MLIDNNDSTEEGKLVMLVREFASKLKLFTNQEDIEETRSLRDRVLLKNFMMPKLLLDE